MNDPVLAKAHNVVTLLVSATPYCLLTRHSRVPRWYSEAGYDRLLCWDKVAGNLVDAEMKRAAVKDWHVVDWSEVVWKQCQLNGFFAHLRCHPGNGTRSENGFWYVTVGPDLTLSTVCVQDADVGGLEFVIWGKASRPGGREVQLRVPKSASHDGGFVAVGVSDTDHGKPRKRTLCLKTSESDASVFTLILGQGEGLVALEYHNPSDPPGPEARSWIVGAGVHGVRLERQEKDIKAKHLFRLARPKVRGADTDHSPSSSATYVRATLGLLGIVAVVLIGDASCECVHSPGQGTNTHAPNTLS